MVAKFRVRLYPLVPNILPHKSLVAHRLQERALRQNDRSEAEMAVEVT